MNTEPYERALRAAGYVKNAAGSWEDPAIGEDGVSDPVQLCEMLGLTVPELKTYSVLMAWHDHDPEEGEYGATVRAEDSGDAVRQTRRLMWSNDLFHDDDPVEMPSDAELELHYGRLIECSEGAIWQAQDLEQALRGIVTAADANDLASLALALERARNLLKEIEGGGE